MTTATTVSAKALVDALKAASVSFTANGLCEEVKTQKYDNGGSASSLVLKTADGLFRCKIEEDEVGKYKDLEGKAATVTGSVIITSQGNTKLIVADAVQLK